MWAERLHFPLLRPDIDQDRQQLEDKAREVLGLLQGLERDLFSIQLA